MDAGSLATSEEDVLSYALFPEIAKEYFLHRELS
jgi:pyruvate/oxaloacetate carboxyltransferase